MKRILITTIISAFFVIACGDGSKNETPGRGELGGVCYPNETCNEGFICDTENNICINEPDDTDTHTNDDADAIDGTDTINDTDTIDDDTEPTDDTDPANEECEIDDSFETSSFSEYYRLRTKSDIDIVAELSNERLVKPDNEYLSMEINLKENDYNFDQNTKRDYNVLFSAISADNGDLTIMAEKAYSESESYGHVIMVGALVSKGILTAEESENLKIDPNGRLNFEAPIVEVVSTVLGGGWGDATTVKMCVIAVNKSRGQAPYSGKGRTQLCLGENRNFELRENIKIGIDAELTTDEEEIIAFYNADRDQNDPDYIKSMEDLCSESCLYANTEMNEETGKCACKEGYKWDGFDFMCKIDQGN
ncbi:hypothetical protein J6Z39_10565 [bacterium]|nr:hypothetical protein [bacterium]